MALAAAVTGMRRTRAVVPRGGSAAGITVISAVPNGDHGAGRRMIPFPEVAVEGRRSGPPVASGVMMTVPFVVMTVPSGVMTLTA
jgi:hypothetical protein